MTREQYVRLLRIYSWLWVGGMFAVLVLVAHMARWSYA